MCSFRNGGETAPSGCSSGCSACLAGPSDEIRPTCGDVRALYFPIARKRKAEAKTVEREEKEGGAKI